MNGRPNQGEQLAGIAGLALILIMFLFAWYGADTQGVNVNGADAFDAYSDWVNIILVFAAFAGMELAVFGSKAARFGPPLTTATAALGGVSAIIILIYIISPPDFPTFGIEGGQTIEMGRKIGCWLGLISAALVAVGGYLAMQEEAAPSRRPRPRAGEAPGGPGEPPSAPPPPSPPPSGPPSESPPPSRGV